MRNITPIAALPWLNSKLELLKENFFQKLLVQLTLYYNTEPWNHPLMAITKGNCLSKTKDRDYPILYWPNDWHIIGDTGIFRVYGTSIIYQQFV